MAKGKVKKGFASYLLVLLLAIVATFLIIVTVMLFSPFKNILGFQYFTYKNSQIQSYATAETENDVFNFQTLENLNINCGYASVKLERYYNIDTPAIRFESAMSGFARSDQDTEFSYQVFYSDSSKKELNVTVHEPEGFMYFSKKLTISVLIPTSSSYSFEYTNVNITNKSGNIYVGNSTKTINIDEQQDRNYISFKNLDIKTNKGKVFFHSYTRENFKSLFIKNESGNVESNINLNVAENLSIYSNGSRMTFKNIVFNGSNNVTLSLGNSEIYTPYLKSNVNLAIKGGYLDIDEFEGALVANDAVEQMGNATINIKEFDGYMSLPYANSSKVNLGKVTADSQIYIHATSGDINIDEMNGNVADLETTKGDINVVTNGTDIKAKSTSGNINIRFNNLTATEQIDLQSTSGQITFEVPSNKKFNLKVMNNKGDLRTDSKVKVSGLDIMPEIEVEINGGGQKVVIVSDGSVNVVLA